MKCKSHCVCSYETRTEMGKILRSSSFLNDVGKNKTHGVGFHGKKAFLLVVSLMSFLILLMSGDVTGTPDNTADKIDSKAINESEPMDIQKAPVSVRFKKTTVENLESILQEATTRLEGVKGRWTFTFEDVSMAVMVDLDHDRMRIIAPIVEVDKIAQDQFQKMLEANFHSALDTRYCISNNVVYAAFIHPLSPLHDTEFASALMQVANLAKTFGSTYSSGEMQYQSSKGLRKY